MRYCLSMRPSFAAPQQRERSLLPRLAAVAVVAVATIYGLRSPLTLSMAKARSAMNQNRSESRLAHFAVILGTGRIGSKFLTRFFQSHGRDVTSHHERLVDRLGDTQHASLDAILDGYFGSLLQSGNRNGLEGNPAFTEYLALRCGANPRELNEALMGHAERISYVWIVRDPTGYCNSLLSQDFAWKWFELPHFERTFGVTRQAWNSTQGTRRALLAWTIKNHFCLKFRGFRFLTVRFRELFGVARSATLAQIVRFLEMETAEYDDTIFARRINVHSRGTVLSEAEKQALLMLTPSDLKPFC
jgi:hypothetical protein